MRGLIVRREHFQQIVQGGKTQTRRLHRNPMRVGQVVVLKKNWFDEWVPRTLIEVTKSYEERLGDMTNVDAQKEGFSDLESFKSNWFYYTGLSWCPNLILSVYEFKLI